ncbi:winged helix-turn-helix transcriptional regulator [Gordonia sp. NPDC003376]
METPTAHSGLGIDDRHRELVTQILDTWSVVVLERLCEQPMRFNELRRAIPTVTQKSLTTTLRRLERNGIVDRVVLDSRPIAIEYRITPLGKTLREPIDALLDWVTGHSGEVGRARVRYDEQVDR